MRTGARVALKVIHPHLAIDAQVRGRLVREARILRRLRANHIGALLDFGEAAHPYLADVTLVYLVLEFLEGTALDAYIAERGLPSPERAIELGMQIAGALAEAHEQGVIHRDLKPGNVFVRAETEEILVLDFGMAKALYGEMGTTDLTQENMIFGTPEYMAPEQARGDELDVRCDVYAVGVILYELLTGTVPFSGSTPIAVLTMQLTHAPIPPQTRSPARGISTALEAVVMHALAKEPENRYPTARSLARALQSALANPKNELAVHPSQVRETLWESMATAATIPSLPVSAPPPSSKRRTFRQAAREEPRLWIWFLVVMAVGVALGAYWGFRVR